MTAQPANLVNLEGVHLAYGTRVLLDGVWTGVADGERIGVVGRNGAGKSSLLQLLARRRPPDLGRVTHTGGLRAGLLTQVDQLDPAASVRVAVVGEALEHTWRSDPRTRDVADRLLAGVDFQAVIGSLSGGERRRVALAGLLLADLDLLLLDEPTNHLDVEAVDWLARHLAGCRGAVVTVTHDRWFLDAVCERTWELADGRLFVYDGGYSAYVLARAERDRVADATDERRRNLLRKELAWLRRGPPARSSKPTFRVEAANALIADEPAPRDTVELVAVAGQRLGRTVYDVEEVTVCLGGRNLLDQVTWRLGPGDRVGVVGVNGAGKTTLLRLLAGEVSAGAGTVRVGTTVRAGYLPQTVAQLPADLRAVEAVEQVRSVVDLGRGRELTARQLAERLGFTGERLWTAVADLSGGERRRLQLLRLLVAGPNVLLLDEPTNDLDVETLGALEDLLDAFAGTLVVVSHDRYFLERVCDRFVGMLGDGHVRDLPGGVPQYLRSRHAASAAGDHPTPGPGGPAAGQPATLAAQVRAARKELARLERRLERLSQLTATLHTQLAAHSTDHVRVSELDTELRAVQRETAELEDAWLEAAAVVQGGG